MDSRLERELFDFVALEARLLDAQRWDEWLALFAEHGRYWVPLAGEGQADTRTHNSLADEDRLLLQVRIARLQNPRAHSQHPPSRCQHVLQRPSIESADALADRFELRTPFVYVESRGPHSLTLTGSARHRLVRQAGTLRIELKRVDLLDAGAPLPVIQLFP
jgi:3-phenylpropionate/cinnamic acid dioxygenase small subunit